jgi:uncharacterized protein (DUF849 family)
MDTKQLLQTNVIDEMGLQNLPPDQKQALLDKMAQTVQGRVLDRVLDTLSADQRQQFESLLATDADPAKLDEFLKQNIPDYDKLVLEILMQFKQEMITDAQAMHKVIAQAEK